MGKRVFTFFIGTAIIVPVLIFSDTWILQAFICLATTLALNEMYACIGQKKEYLCVVPGYLFGILTPVLYRLLSEKGELVYELRFFKMFACCILLYAFFLLAVSVMTERKYTLESASTMFIVTFYIVFGMNSLAFVRSMESGKHILVLIILSAFSTDIFAYLVGRFFGKHKLCPKISPKKTIEGAVGGIVFCVISIVIYGLLLSVKTVWQPNYLILVFFAIVCSVIAQLGDLVFSCIKRKFNVKDFGWILPGHGGVCDRFDSVLAVAPFLFTLFSFLSFLPSPFYML